MVNDAPQPFPRSRLRFAIVLAGAVTLLLLGFRPAGRGAQREQLRLGIIISIVLLVLISIPLGAVFISSVNESQTRQTIQRVLISELEAECQSCRDLV